MNNDNIVQGNIKLNTQAITNTPRILILSNSSSGLYEFRNEVVEDLLRDHEVFISLPDEDAYTKILADEGCHIFHTGFNRRGMNPIMDAILLLRYIRLIRRIRPQMVLTYTIKPNIYGGMACRLTHTNYAANITGLGTAIQGGGILSKALIRMYKVALNKAKEVFYQNEYNMEFMLGRGVGSNNQSILLPGSGVNIYKHSYKPYPSEDKGVRVLAVLRIMKDKGIEEFLYAADKICDEFDAKFVLAGGYEEETRQEYEPQIQRLVDSGKLEYVGFCDKIDELYENCHVLIHPSYHEGLSNVCLEAAACGRPIITTDVPGCRETVIPGETGLLFRSKDKNAAYKAITDILSMTSSERATMGQRGRNYVEENFNRETVVRKYREVVGYNIMQKTNIIERKKLLIIGNGFDSAHDLKTGYVHFKNYMCDMIREGEGIEKSEKTLRIKNIPKSTIPNIYTANITVADYHQERKIVYWLIDDVARRSHKKNSINWGEFEDYLGQLNYKKILRKWRADRWEKMCLRDAINDISGFFFEWINTIDLSGAKKIEPYQSKINCKNDIALSFNYTETLEHVYGMDSSNICYIHGKRETDDNAKQNKKMIPIGKDNTQLVVGFGSKYLKSIRLVEETELLRGLYKDTESIINHYNDFFDRIVDEDIKEIYTWGFSFSNADIPYIEKICDTLRRDNRDFGMTWYIAPYGSILKIIKERIYFCHCIRKAGFRGKIKVNKIKRAKAGTINRHNRLRKLVCR